MSALAVEPFALSRTLGEHLDDMRDDLSDETASTGSSVGPPLARRSPGSFSVDVTIEDLALIAPGERILVAREEFGDGQRSSRGDRVQVTLTRMDVKVGRRRDGSVFVQRSSAGRHDGLTRSGKRFTRWSTSSVGILTGKPGHPILEQTYQAGYGWISEHHFTDRSRRIFPTLDIKPFGTAQPYVDALLPEPVAMWDYYPLLGFYIDRNFSDGNVDWWSRNPAGWAPGGLRRCFVGARNAHDLTRNVFGVRRHSFDLTAATARADLALLSLAWQFRGLVPDTTLIDLLQRRYEHTTATPPLIRHHLLRLSPTARAALAVADLPGLYHLGKMTALAPVDGVPDVTSWPDLLHEIRARTPEKNAD